MGSPKGLQNLILTNSSKKIVPECEKAEQLMDAAWQSVEKCGLPVDKTRKSNSKAWPASTNNSNKSLCKLQNKVLPNPHLLLVQQIVSRHWQMLRMPISNCLGFQQAHQA